MNQSAARACRADRRLAMLRGADLKTASVPREMKRLWSTLDHRARGRLRDKWKFAAAAIGTIGRAKWVKNHAPQVVA